MAFDKNDYDNQYKRENYDVIRALIPKGKAQELKAYAKAHGTSVSALIVDALESRYGFDLSKG